jgi:hypothetical protein
VAEADADDDDAADEATEESPEPSQDDMAQQCLELESQQRLWLKVCKEVVQVNRKADESERVARAIDSLVIAAAARAKRILGADAPLER